MLMHGTEMPFESYVISGICGADHMRSGSVWYPMISGLPIPVPFQIDRFGGDGDVIPALNVGDLGIHPIPVDGEHRTGDFLAVLITKREAEVCLFHY
jgi:hypothetical protein